MSVKLAFLVLSAAPVMALESSLEEFCKYKHDDKKATCSDFDLTSLRTINFKNGLKKLKLSNVTGSLNLTGAKNLTSLTVLTVSRSKIANFTLDSVPNLMFLALVSNQQFPNLVQNLFTKAVTLNWLLLIGNNHTIEANSLSFLKNLTWLHIQNQKFEHLTGGFLQETTKLHELTIRNCHLKRIDADAFDNLGEMEILSLNFNKLTHFEAGTFKNLPNLRILELHHNKFVDFSLSQFRGLTDLEILGLPSGFLRNFQNGADELLESFPKLEKIEVKKRDLLREDVNVLLNKLRARNIHIIGTPHDCHHFPCHHVS